jgi:hypothetical protein
VLDEVSAAIHGDASRRERRRSPVAMKRQRNGNPVHWLVMCFYHFSLQYLPVSSVGTMDGDS